MSYNNDTNLNRLIDDLCVARAADVAAIEHAHSLAMGAPRPYSDEKMRELCDAGDLMQITHARKMIALGRMRDGYPGTLTSECLEEGAAGL